MNNKYDIVFECGAVIPAGTLEFVAANPDGRGNMVYEFRETVSQLDTIPLSRLLHAVIESGSTEDV